MAHWLSCSAACGIFLDQGLNWCPLHWQVDSYPLHHQGSPQPLILFSLTSPALTPLHTLFLFMVSIVPTGFLYSFHSLFASLCGYFQLIFLLTYWFFFFFLFLGQVCCWISVLNSSVYSLYCVHAKSPPSCVTLCDPMDCSPPGSSVHGIHQARILEWVAMYSSRGSSRPRDRTWVSYISCAGIRVLYP